MDITAISRFLESQKKSFLTEKNYSFEIFKAGLYGYRRFNMMGRDYYFIHEGNYVNFSAEKCLAMHEAARKHVNDQYKMPKAMRFVVPNIVSIFLSQDGFSEETVELALRQQRPWQGGEVHDMFFIDTTRKECYGPGYHKVRVEGVDFTLKKTDPTNRSIELIRELLK
ncbi:MAG: hypothetical protein A2W93_15790 [Bacteroidetes bacterium GWF2_43_63]|nr:MAG: hypothetical protein A2W94_13600 [Bacteroidetes bacterium GWE2_42_42]OFY53130.1 MAG: hypothetical protein A2W93_15790 [Bacteroidetes bacterium GWF2_43_63]HBG70356.1 hypothetical protein [Bacteroidales bacterium]HCB60597.1 hypothetical protein [Bacteroidales bacterium]HCY22966.1 hypothetical protein [Bacteroidales bacterium]